MLLFFLRCLAVAAIYLGVGFGLVVAGARPPAPDLVAKLAFFGALSYFLGEYVGEWPIVSHGATAQPTPPVVWKVLGVVFWASGLVILIAG